MLVGSDGFVLAIAGEKVRPGFVVPTVSAYLPYREYADG
jgi:hypothetical protein